LSVGLGAQTRVGNLLGAGKAKKAKQTAVVIPLIFFGWMCLHGNVFRWCCSKD
jgi:Na+-driven multidrug efflux pump